MSEISKTRLFKTDVTVTFLTPRNEHERVSEECEETLNLLVESLRDTFTGAKYDISYAVVTSEVTKKADKDRLLLGCGRELGEFDAPNEVQ